MDFSFMWVYGEDGGGGHFFGWGAEVAGCVQRWSVGEKGAYRGYIIIRYHRRRFDNARRVAGAQKNMTQI